MTATTTTTTTVVVVDDATAVLDEVCSALRLRPDLVVVGMASDGEQALGLVREHRPDVLVLDLSMPGTDGFEVLRALRRDAADVRVVVHSGFAAADTAADVLELGAVAYVEKGTPLDRLAAVVRGAAADEHRGTVVTAERAPSTSTPHDGPARVRPAAGAAGGRSWGLLGLVLLIAACALALVLAQDGVRDREREAFTSDVVTVADAIAGNVDRSIRDLETATRAVLASGTDEDAVRLVPEVLDSRGLIIVGTDGVVQAASNESGLGADVGDRAHIVDAFTTGRGVSGVVVSLSDGSPIYVVAVALPDGRVASLAYEVDDGLLGSALPTESARVAPLAWVVDGNGEVVATTAGRPSPGVPTLEQALDGPVPEAWEAGATGVDGTGWQLVVAAPYGVVHDESEGLVAAMPWLLLALLAGAGAVALTLRDRASAQAAALATANAELERSNRDLQDFAYVASHDLQEPLRKVASFTQLLEDRYGDVLDERGRTFLHYASDGAVRMQQLVADLLAFSRAGSQDRDRHPVDLGAVLRDAAEAVSTSVVEADARIGLPEASPPVLGDAGQLAQVFQNLLSNAVKFRDPSRPCTVEVTTHHDGDDVTVRVRDNGIGVPHEQREHVFGVFTRLHRREEVPGTGIGLALVRRIVEHHGGTVALGGHDGPGTTVTLRLPAAPEARP